MRYFAEKFHPGLALGNLLSRNLGQLPDSGHWKRLHGFAERGDLTGDGCVRVGPQRFAELGRQSVQERPGHEAARSRGSVTPRLPALLAAVFVKTQFAHQAI